MLLVSSEPDRGWRRVLAAVVLAQITESFGATQELCFDPRAGDETTRRFELEISLRSDRDFTFDLQRSIRVLDRTETVRDGRPLRLKRTYELLGGSVSVYNGDMAFYGSDGWASWETKSELAGETVRFDWIEEESRYVPTSEARRRIPPALLEGLEMDMDFSWLLPEAPVDPGERWSLGQGALMRLLLPGGDVKLAATREPPLEEQWGISNGSLIPNLPPDPSLWSETFEGEAEAVYERRLERDGIDAALIRVSFEIRSERDVTEWMHAMVGDYSNVWTFDTALLRWTLDGEVLVIWDLEKGRIASLEGRAATRVAYRGNSTRRWGREPVVEELDEDWRGVVRFRASMETEAGAIGVDEH